MILIIRCVSISSRVPRSQTNVIQNVLLEKCHNALDEKFVPKRGGPQKRMPHKGALSGFSQQCPPRSQTNVIQNVLWQKCHNALDEKFVPKSGGLLDLSTSSR